MSAYRRLSAMFGAAVAAAAVPLAQSQADDQPPYDVPLNDVSLYDLVDAAAQRLQTADPVAASKWLNGGPITDPVRVGQVLDAVAQNAESNGTPTAFVIRVFTDQINATEAIQYSRFSSWKLDPAAAPASAPDLSASRAAIDDLNLRMVSQIARRWPVLRSPDCRSQLDAAKAGVSDARGLDPLFQQALDSATRSYCG